ncbi:MAG TPA: hypothetical protein VGK89_07270 [Candidatus Eisenbacteria bacterium]|jgi:uncharacterized protein involved in exopolysaccharide biosynthesis
MNEPLTPITATARQATLREFLAIAFRRKRIIIGLFLATTITVALITLLSPVSYISFGRVLLKRGEQASALEPHRQIYSDWEQDLGSEIEVARSQPVLERARQILRSEPLANGVVLTLDPEKVDVDVVGKSNVLRIAYVDRDAVAARRVCDALLRGYMDFRQKSLDLFTNPRRFFEEELARVEDELNRKQEMRRVYANRSRLVDVEDQKRDLVTLRGQLVSRQSEMNSKLAEARAISKVMRELREHPEVDLPLPQAVVGYDAVFELSRKVVEEEARLAQLRERYRDEAPEVVTAKETVTNLRGLLAREVEARILVADSRTEVLEAQEAALKRDVAGVESQLDEMPDKETALSEIDRELGLLKSRYETLAKNRDLARVTEHTASGVAVLLLSPAAAAKPNNARDYVRLALAPAFSLVVGVGLAFFIDGLDITVHTAGHAEDAADLPVLAAVRERRRPA